MACRGSGTWRSSGTDHGLHPLDRVVGEAAKVPWPLQRLAVAGLVDRPRAQLVLAGRGLPRRRPADPGPPSRALAEIGRPPGRTAVDAHLDPGDGRPTRPGPPPQQV